MGFAKCNVDASVARHGDRVIVAAAYKNRDGLYIGSSITLNHISDVPTLEALA